MENGASGSHDDFLKKINDELSEILDRLSKSKSIKMIDKWILSEQINKTKFINFLVDADESKLHDTVQRIRDLAIMSAGKVWILIIRLKL